MSRLLHFRLDARAHIGQFKFSAGPSESGPAAADEHKPGTRALVLISGLGSRSRAPAGSGSCWPGFPLLTLCVVTGEQLRRQDDRPVHAPADGGASAMAIRKTLSAALCR